MEHIHFIAELGFHPLSEDKIIHVNDDTGLNLLENIRVERRRIEYSEGLRKLGVSTRSKHWDRITGESK